MSESTFNDAGKEINKTLSAIEDKLKNAPAEILRIRKHRNSVQFFISHKDTDTGRVITKYVRKRNESSLIPLFNKYYFEKLQAELRKEQSLLKFKSGLNMTGKGEIYDQLPKQLKEVIKPIYTSTAYSIDKWYKSPFKSNSFSLDSSKEYVTDLGEHVRSRAECLLANSLNKMGLKYHYEELLLLKKGQKRYPDFKIAHPATGDFYYIEFFGMMDDPEYAAKAFAKISEYAADPIYPRMIYIFDHKDAPFSNVSVNNILKTVFFN